MADYADVFTWNTDLNNITTTTYTANTLDYAPMYTYTPGVTVDGSSVVTEASINAMIDKRLDERLQKGSFADRLQMKYPVEV